MSALPDWSQAGWARVWAARPGQSVPEVTQELHMVSPQAPVAPGMGPGRAMVVAAAQPTNPGAWEGGGASPTHADSTLGT